MGFKQRLEAFLGLNTTEFDSKLNQSKTGIRGFGASLMAAAAAGAAAFKILIDWAKDTVFGIEAINVTTKVTKQLLTDLIMQQGTNLKAAVQNAKEQSKINDDNIREGYVIKTLQSELSQLITASADQTKSHAERLEILTQAMAKEKELKEFMLKDAREELQVAHDFWKMNLQSVDAKKAYYEIAGKVRDIEGMDSRRLQSQFTAELVAQRKRAEELVDAFTPLPPTLEEIKDKAEKITKAMTSNVTTRPGSSGSNVFGREMAGFSANLPNTLAGAPPQYYGTNILAAMMGEDWQKQMDEVAKLQALEDLQERLQGALSSMRDMAIDYGGQIVEALGEALGGGDVKEIGKGLLMSLANFLSQFGQMMIVAGLGVQAFVEGMATVNGPLLVAAGVAALVAAGAIRGMMSSAGKSGLSGGGSSSSFSSGTQTIKVVGEIRGKDIYLVQKRYEEDN